MAIIGPAVPLQNIIVGDFYGIDDLITKLQKAYDEHFNASVYGAGDGGESSIGAWDDFAGNAISGYLIDARLARVGLTGLPDSALNRVYLSNGKKIDLTQENEFSLLTPETQAGIRANPELALLSQFALFEVPQTGDLVGWRLWTRNPANGDFLSVGAEGGVNALSNVRWHPTYGLLIPVNAYMTINDEPDWVGMVVMSVIGAVAGAGITSLTNAGGVMTGMSASMTDAEIMALYQTAQAGGTLPAGVAYTSSAAFNAAYDAAQWVSFGDGAQVAQTAEDVIQASARAAESSGLTQEQILNELASQTPDLPSVANTAKDIASKVPLPDFVKTTRLSDFLTDLSKLIPSASTAKTAAGLVGTFLSLYKAVTGAGGKTTGYQLRPSPLTADQIAAQRPGVVNMPGSFDLKSALPLLAMAAIAIATN